MKNEAEIPNNKTEHWPKVHPVIQRGVSAIDLPNIKAINVIQKPAKTPEREA
jgi:hypothetical protein